MEEKGRFCDEEISGIGSYFLLLSDDVHIIVVGKASVGLVGGSMSFYGNIWKVGFGASFLLLR